MRLFRTLCATLGTLFIVSTPSLGAYAAAIPPLSETSVLATDVHLTDAASALSVENKGSATVAAPLRAAAEEASSTPSLWLLTALIISIIILVLVVVFIVYALRSQKAKKKSQAQRVPPSSQGSVPFPVRPGMPEASAYTGGPAQFGQGQRTTPTLRRMRHPVARRRAKRASSGNDRRVPPRLLLSSPSTLPQLAAPLAGLSALL